VPVRTERLNAASQLSYKGLGPIALGMSFDEAEHAGRVTVRQTSVTACEFHLVPEPDSGLGSFPASVSYTVPTVIDTIHVSDPLIATTEGIHRGSSAEEVRQAYRSVAESELPGYPDISRLTITNSEGRAIVFFVVEGRVSYMKVGSSEAIVEQHTLC
jgi:hypothetical protein